MSSTRTFLSSTTARLAWGGIVLALGLGLVLSFMLAEGSVGNAESDAEAQAVDRVNETLFDTLAPEDLERKVAGELYRGVLTDVQAGILDEDATRVRIWSPDGLLVFSTEASDAAGEALAGENAQIDAALVGQTVSIPTAETVPFADGLVGSSEQLFVTYVPLRLAGEPGVHGVVEVSQRYAAIETAASEMWGTVRVVLIVALGLAVVMFVVSLVVRPRSKGSAEAAEAQPSGQGVEGQEARERASRTEAELRKALERAERAEAEARTATERLAEATARGREAETDERLVELEHRATKAEKRAAAAEAALQAAQRVATTGAPARGVPGPGIPKPAAVEEELRARLGAVEGERDELAAEVDRLRAEPSVAAAAEVAGDGADAAEIEKLRELLAEQERRVAEHEGLAADAVRRALEAEERASEIEGALRATEATVGGLETRLAEAEAEAESVRASLVAPEPNGSGNGTGTVEAGGDDRALELQTRLQELEDLRRSEVAELQRAHETLANTQFESTQARRRVKELEERLRELEAEPARDAAAVFEQEPAVEPDPEPAPEPARDDVASPPLAPEAGSDDGEVSLRERLARAAAARHRAPGAEG